MKRTKPLKRTRIKRGKLKGKFLDPTFRRAYCEEAWFDEVLFWTGFRINDWGIIREDNGGTIEEPRNGVLFDAHHIGHRGAKRDWRTNLIFIPRVSHDAIHFGTRGQTIDGVLLCLWAKLLKREQTGVAEEFDLKLLNECFGQSVLGWLHRDFGQTRFNDIRDEIVELA